MNLTVVINWRTRTEDLPEMITLQELLAFAGVSRTTLWRHQGSYPDCYPKPRGGYYTRLEAQKIRKILRGVE